MGSFWHISPGGANQIKHLDRTCQLLVLFLWRQLPCLGSLSLIKSCTYGLPLWSTFALDWGCGLWAVGCGLWAVGCGLWAVGSKRNPEEKIQNIPPEKSRYQYGKEVFGAVLMNEESISSKRETRTTSERHNNKKILTTTVREKTTSTMVNDWQ